MDISIIIATRNRSKSLSRTLQDLQKAAIPADVTAEIVVADNGSTDDTRLVASRASTDHVRVRYLFEGRKGKSNALNAAVAQARGEILLFTDDDVRPAPDWVEQMIGPLAKRECDGALGRIELAPELLRPWMSEAQKSMLAFYNGPGDGPLQFIGANMGVHRSVFGRVPGFDPEIGPGALGLFEDTLLSWQMTEAGMKLRYVPEALVVHHPDPRRLLRRHLLASSQTFGASMGYVLHHWCHEQMPAPRLSYYYLALKLMVRRLVQPPPSLDAEGAPPWEGSYVASMAKCRQFLLERRRPRNYSKRGLTKQVHGSPRVGIEATPVGATDELAKRC